MDGLRKTMLAVAGCVAAFAAQAVAFTELTDQFELTDELAAASTQYKASSSLTIRLTGTATDGVLTILPSFYIPDGVTLTVDGSAVAGLATVRLKGGLRGTGTIAFGAGITKLSIGGAPTMNNILGDANKMSALESAVTFAEASGIVELVEGVSLVRWPANYTIAENTIVATMGEDLFSGTSLTLDQGWNLMLTREDALPEGFTVTVPEGRTLYYRPTLLSAATEGTCVQSWKGLQSATHAVNIVLDGGAVSLQAKSTTGLYNTIKGDLTGSGTVTFVNAGALKFDGRIALNGTFNLTGLDDGKDCIFSAADGSSFADTTIANCESSLVTFNATSGAELAVKSLSSASTLNLKIGAGANICFDAVDASAVAVSGDGDGATASFPGCTAAMTLAPGVTLARGASDVANPVTLSAGGAESPVWSLTGTASSSLPVALAYTASELTSAEIVLAGKLELVTHLPVPTVRVASPARM